MDVVENIKCSLHNKSYEFLCYQCNILLCSRCSNSHLRENQNHICDHIEDIKDSLKNFNLNNNNKNNSKSQFSNEISDIWNIIKKSTEEIEFLFEKETEISNSFRSLHEYLVIEEHKLKKPITEDINTIKEIINININSLKSIVNVINISNNNIDNNQMSNSGEELDVSESSNKIDKYSTDIIIKSIKESDSIQKFIGNNKQTIFYINQSILDNYKHIYNNDVDMILLELINKFNKIHKQSSSEAIIKNIIENKINYQYSIDINNIKEIISTILQKSQEYSNYTDQQCKEKNALIKKTIGITILKLGEKWYLINKIWYDKWDSNSYSSKELGPIKNESLLIQGTEHLRLDSIEDQDFIVVPESCWDYFKSYGCPTPIVRKVTKNVILEIDYKYPQCLKFFKSSQPNKIIDHYVCKSETISEVKERVCKIFEINSVDVRIWDYYNQTKYAELKNEENVSNSKLVENQCILLDERLKDGSWPQDTRPRLPQ